MLFRCRDCRGAMGDPVRSFGNQPREFCSPLPADALCGSDGGWRQDHASPDTHPAASEPLVAGVHHRRRFGRQSAGYLVGASCTDGLPGCGIGLWLLFAVESAHRRPARSRVGHQLWFPTLCARFSPCFLRLCWCGILVLSPRLPRAEPRQPTRRCLSLCSFPAHNGPPSRCSTVVS